MNDAITLEGLQQPDYLIKRHVDAYNAKVRLHRMDSAGMRFYYRVDEQAKKVHFYGSVTSIKSQVTGLAHGIVNKKVEMGKQAFDAYLNERANFGTFFHIQAAELTRSGNYDLSKLPTLIEQYRQQHDLSKSETAYWLQQQAKGLQSWFATMEAYNISPIAIEIPLFSDAYGFAGTIDLVCEMDAKNYTDKTPPEKRQRVIAIIDWKSGGIFEDYAFQLELNRVSWTECFPDSAPITHLYNWTWNDWRKEPTFTLKNQNGTKYADMQLIEHYLGIYAKTGKLKPDPVRSFSSGLLTRGKTNLSRLNPYVEPEQYILQKHGLQD